MVYFFFLQTLRLFFVKGNRDYDIVDVREKTKCKEGKEMSYISINLFTSFLSTQKSNISIPA